MTKPLVQDICLEQRNDGPAFTRQFYDRFPPEVRARISASPYNLCCACIFDRANHSDDPEKLLRVIYHMEQAIKYGLVSG